MNHIFDRFLSFLETASKGPITNFDYHDPQTLRKAFDFSLHDEGLGPEALNDILAGAVQYTPQVESLTYLNYLYSAPDPVGVVGDWLAALVNTNVHAYEASPVFSLAEMELVRELARVVGYGADSDGIFCPGGSYSNLLATYLARNKAMPEGLKQGLSGHQKLVMLASEQAHYSYDRAAALLGLGTNAVYKVKCDAKGRMVPDDLKRRIDQALDQGEHPFMVGATLGTTVLGAFDPINDIQGVLADYPGIWLHVDASWGGAVLISDQYRSLAHGIENADSIVWDFHKALHAPILCSALLVKNKFVMKNMFSDDTSYLFHDEEGNPESGYNLGEKTPQCGRRADAFKFWLMWKIRGKKYFEAEVGKRYDLTARIIERITSTGCFLIHDDRPDFWNICFWYIPSHLKQLKRMENFTATEKSEITQVTTAIHQRLKKDGRVQINFGQLPNLPAFLRLVVSNSRLDDPHLDLIFELIESFGKTYEVERP